jgi:hypothetical protein
MAMMYALSLAECHAQSQAVKLKAASPDMVKFVQPGYLGANRTDQE